MQQFVLGQAPVEIYRNETALIMATKYKGEKQLPELPDMAAAKKVLDTLGMSPSSFFSDFDSSVNTLTLPFSDGTPCDLLENTNRSTIVELRCGPRNEVVSIREESTCQYRLVAELVPLCQLPRFAPVEPNVGFYLFYYLKT